MHAADNEAPILPPPRQDSIQTDRAAQIENLLVQRREEALQILRAPTQAEPPPEPQTKAKPAKGKAAPPVAEPAAPTGPPEITARDITQILAELREVKVQTPLDQFLEYLTVSPNTPPLARHEHVVADDE